MKLNPLSFSGDLNLKGLVEEGHCPKCEENTRLLIVETSLTPVVYSVPMPNLRKTLLAVCPKCGAKFTLTKELTQSLTKGFATVVLVDNLTECIGDDYLVDWTI